MELRLGQVLVEQGVLTEQQVDAVMAEQSQTGEPFGVLCEQLFDIDPSVIEEAWAEQYSTLTRRVRPEHETLDKRAMELVSRRQAWQFRVLPIRFDGNELMVATTREHLVRALRFATNVIRVPVYFVMCSEEELGNALSRHYPMPGMTPACVREDTLDRLLEMVMRK
ncbi:MAG TPA: hypothetical protein VG711_01480 [Phycisphaerales bacterium]|nr:hypothetical protein [Phycisphaerales bacterium]